MAVYPLPKVINQAKYPGVGDVDDCNVIVPFWSLLASGTERTRAKLPTVTAFRAAAGVPDKPGPNGLTNAQALQAINKLYPDAEAFSFVRNHERFVKHLNNGAVASVSIKNNLLPTNMQFGFSGAHQIGIVRNPNDKPGVSDYYLAMNPLGKEGTNLIPISRPELERAAYGLFGDGKIHAVIIPDAAEVVNPIPDSKDARIIELEKLVNELRMKIAAARDILA